MKQLDVDVESKTGLIFKIRIVMAYWYAYEIDSVKK